MKIVLLITVVESAIVAALMILWRFRTMKTVAVPAASNLNQISIPTAESRRLSAIHESRWAFINGWKVAPQSNDRTPVNLGAARRTASASGERSFARRRHQAMYKQWSQERHD